MAHKKAQAKTKAKKAKRAAKPKPHRAPAKVAKQPKSIAKSAKSLVKRLVGLVKPAPKPEIAARKPDPLLGKKLVAGSADFKLSDLKKLKAEKGEKPDKKSEKGKGITSSPVTSAPRRDDGWFGPLPDKPMPRRTRPPAEAPDLTKREMEQVLTVGMRGVTGEGSLKGRLVVYQGFPYLEVMGRDKRELLFLLQGPDQEVLPAYVEHKVSVSGLIRRHHNYGGTVDVRKYSAKKPEEVVEVAPVVEPAKLRLLSPGEVETLSSAGMSVGLRGFATLRGRLEQSGEEFYLVVSNAGTRQQVGFTLEGKATRGLKKFVGEIMVATGVVEKRTAWGGTVQAEIAEPRAPEFPPVSRAAIDVVDVEASGAGKETEVKLNHGMSVKLPERHGYTWAIEPQTAKRVSLREVNVQSPGGQAVREFFFTPRNPGLHEVEFFLGKVHNPMQVSKTFKLVVNVKQPPEVVS